MENLASTRAAARDAGLDYRSGGVGNNASLFAQSMRQASEQSRDDAKKLDDLRSMLGEKIILIFCKNNLFFFDLSTPTLVLLQLQLFPNLMLL